MSLVEHLTQATYLAAAALFIFSLRWLSRPNTARRGVFAGVLGMALAIVGTLLHPEIVGFQWIAIAVFASVTNIVSGFMITDRMLKMFKEKGK